jgi:hypothetical protein
VVQADLIVKVDIAIFNLHSAFHVCLMQLGAMLQWSYFWDLVNLLPVRQLLAVAITGIIAQTIYNLKFHPLAKYPGPKIAAVSNIWWALNR